MKRFIKKSLYKIFVSLFIIFYSFVPPVISMNQLIGLSGNGKLVADAQEITFSNITETITEIGLCLDDAAGSTQNCTANDVDISNVTNVIFPEGEDGCSSPEDTVSFTATWEIVPNASQRYDMGIYFAIGDQMTARTGNCSVSTLPNYPLDTWFNLDEDDCGDVESGSPVYPEISLTVKCLDTDGDNLLNIPYCTAWDNNTTGYCSGPSDALPGTTSKCNCPPDGITVPITVPYSAEIEVVKDLVPHDDPGIFNLYVDDKTTETCVGNGEGTGKIVVGAGTSDEPGDNYMVGESVDGCGTDLNDYDTTISCVDRELTTFDGGEPLTFEGVGPLTVHVDKDDDIVCTITNAKNTGSIKVNKFLDSDGNGTFETPNPSAYDWTLDGGDTEYDMGTTQSDILIGEHTISETPYSNFHFVGWYPNGDNSYSCTNLPEGEMYRNLPATIEIFDNLTTEITLCNEVDVGHLIVQKTTYPSGEVQVFNILATTTEGLIKGDGVGEISDLTDEDYSVAVGTYSVEETVPDSWDLTSNSCINVYVGPGQTEYCLIENTKRGSISGHKLNDPDGILETEDGRTPVFGWTIELWQDGIKIDKDVTDVGGEFSFENLEPGDYLLKEKIEIGSGWVQLSGLSINVTLEPGENDSENDFINVKYPTITIYKNVDENGDGDLDDGVDVIGATDWKWDIDYSENYDTGDTISKYPGTYTITEDQEQKENYYVTSLVCNNGEEYEATESFDVTLESGQDLVCTFTNTRKLGTLIVKKVVEKNHGGNLSASDFEFKIDSGYWISFEADGENEFTEYAGYTYSIVENEVEGYSVEYDNCTDVYVPYGETSICTITNSDIAPTLTVKKVIINAYGGDDTITDFDIRIGNDSISFMPGGTIGEDMVEYPTMPMNITAGVSYFLSEEDPEGYIKGQWVCTDNSTQESVSNPVVLEPGQNVTCTITNNDIAPELKLVKEVENDNGGDELASEWLLSATGGEDGFSVYGIQDNAENKAETTSYTLTSNVEYELGESGPDGYLASEWSCDDGSLVGDKLTLDEGENVTCTIVNNDIASELTLIKEVVNTNGGDEMASEWTLYASGNSGFSGKGVQDPVDNVAVLGFNKVLSNERYVLSEEGPEGYTADDWKCDGGTLIGNLFTLNEGEEAVCTIVNRDIAPTITLIKYLDTNYGGTADENDFCLTIGTTDVQSGEVLEVDANTNYMINEAVQLGYEFVSISGDGCPTSLGGTVNLDEGEDITCTITNRDLPASLEIIKDVTKEHEGEGIYTEDIFGIDFSGYEGVKYISDTEEDPLTAEYQDLSRGMYSFNETDIPIGYAFEGCFPEGYDPEGYRPAADFAHEGENLGEYDPFEPWVELENGDIKTYVCYNEAVRPQLEISKTNDTLDADMRPGDIVTYTITLNMPFDDDEKSTYLLDGVQVIDIIPEGFEYIEGSATGAINIIKYEDNMPATWIIGPMNEGDTKILTYQVRISELQDPGIYDDLAYTYGTDLFGDRFYGVQAGTNPEEKDYFVGTEVTVIDEPEIEEGEVLGAAIELPRTGASSYLTLGALITMIIGSLLLLINPKKKLGNLIVAGILLIGVIAVIKPRPIYAAPLINVQIEEPQSPTDRTSFKIGYVALAIPSGTNLDITCYKSTDGITFDTFGTYSNLSGDCIADESIITQSGTYYFYVKATTNGTTEQSDTVTVKVELEKPSAVEDYDKDEGTCTYTLSFKTADDNRTSKIQIFRSDKQPFTANNETLIKEMPVDPNKEYTYTDNGLPSCDKEYYYALRAVDNLNNTSPFVTDDIVTIVEGETTTTEGTIATSTTVLEEEGEVAGETTDEDGNGDVAGEETTTDEEENGEEDENGEEKTFWQKYWYAVLAAGVILTITVGYTYAQRKRY